MRSSRLPTGDVYDVVIRGGRVLDPAIDTDGIADVVLHRGRIVGVFPSADSIEATREINAEGRLVGPRLVDMHVHCFKGLSSYGLDPDRIGIMSGCTHVNDMGSTGCFTVGGFREWIAERSTTGVTCFPNMLGFGVPENWGFAATALGETSVSA